MKQFNLPLAKMLFLAVLLFFITSISYAQGRKIQGKVIDAVNKSPLVGVTVSVKNSNVATSTDADGNFTLEAPQNGRVLITFVGYQSIEVSASQKNPTIQLSASSQRLNEVVITATGIKKESKRLGYAIQTIDADALTKAREADPINSLKGNAAGLAININSEIGHSPDVIIRGENDPSNRPLFVVDGVPISSDTYNLNPDDIETFTILKGPNAAALYGFQGKNGAIIISTKKGTKDKRGLQVTFNSSTQINKGFIALPKYQDTYGPGDNGKYAFGGGGSSPASYFGNGAVGVGINDYDYDVWGPEFRGNHCLNTMVLMTRLKHTLLLLLMELSTRAM